MEEHPVNAKSAAHDLPSWDKTAALEAAGGDAGLARELLEALIRGLPNELSGLRRSWQANDWPTLTETAHRMRGATSYCGVPALDHCLQKLQRTIRNGDRHRIGIQLEQVEQEAERLTQVVNA